MTWRRGGAALALGAVLLGLMGGCGGPGRGSTTSCSGTVTVATELPTTGTDESLGVPAQDGAELAVTQAGTSHLLGDCSVDLITKDDASLATGAHDPNQGARNMAALTANQKVIGVVGPLHSRVCAAEMPIANNADLVQVTPSCTDAQLTQPVAGANQAGPSPALQPSGARTLFRVCTTDVAEAARAAQEARARGASHALVAHDAEAQGLATAFARDFAEDGGTVVDSLGFTGAPSEVGAAAQDAAAKGADVVFYAGTSSDEAGRLRAQMRTVLFIAADTVVDQQFLDAAGAADEGSLAISAGADPARARSAADFIAAYQSAYGSTPTTYAANAYDAMNIVLTAIKESVDANGGSLPASLQTLRASVRRFVSSISYTGVIGHIAFNSDGESVNTTVTVWQARSGRWTSVNSYG